MNQQMICAFIFGFSLVCILLHICSAHLEGTTTSYKIPPRNMGVFQLLCCLLATHLAPDGFPQPFSPDGFPQPFSPYFFITHPSTGYQYYWS
jgi:hypothetical protein